MKQQPTAKRRGAKGIAKYSHWFAANDAQQSQFINQIAGFYPKSLRYPQKRVQADPLLSTFNLADINWMQVGLFSQLLLAHPCGLATVSNGVTQDFQLARTRHGTLGEQDRVKLNTPNMGLFLSCSFSGKGVETHDGLESNAGDLPGIRSFMTDKPRILVVDDQIAVAMMMVFILSRAGCQAEAALNAEQALQRAQTESFDLLTLDIGMPGRNGFQLFQCLKEIPHLRETPVIFVTGQATTEDRQRALDLGAVDFIEKPFDAREFISRILSHLEESTLA